MLRQTEAKHINKLKRSAEMCEKFLKKSKNSKYFTGAEIWKLYKGDGSGEDVPMDFIEEFAKKNSIILDHEGFDKIFISETEKSIKNLKIIRHENTQLIDICTQLKNIHKIPTTNDSFKYNYTLDTIKEVAEYKKSKILFKL